MNSMSAMSAAEAPRRAHLYVGNLSPRVTEYMLTEIFAVAGPVQHVKIIPDRNYQHGGLNYGFVEYMDMRAAETALQTLNGRKIFDTEIRVNWAYQGQQNKEDTSNHYHVFVGDLSPEVNDEVLGKAFSAFGTLSDARVMWDMNSGKSRGYGFLAFRDKTDAEQAIATMNGEWLGSRAIRVNWANQKTQGLPGGPPRAGGMGGGAPAPMNFQGGPLSYESVVQQTPGYNSTVYVGNLVPYATQADLIPLFQSIGYLSEIRMQADRGFAFVKLDTHEHAAMAIVQLQGQLIHGRPIKCSWGKDRADGGTALTPTSMSPTPTAAPYANVPMYSVPQPNAYGQYGFGAYGGFPNQPGGAGTPGVAAPGMGSPVAPTAQMIGGQSPADVAAATQAAQGQWAGADPNSYYSNYWGGYYGQQAPGGVPDTQGQA
ncbi:hypothetical protein BC628DRAFT_1380106 [Trametes gibbosa]|nr:hypothetical protein BC628DRAFT_1380106 [Trametes gibbosa]